MTSNQSLSDARRLLAQKRDRDLARATWEKMDRAEMLAELEHTERERQAWESHGQEQTFQRERLERGNRNLEIVLDNRNSQLLRITARLSAKETALQRIMDAVTLAEAKRIAREAIRVI